MAQEHNDTTLNGMFKQTYADKIAQVIPESAVLTKMVPLQPADQAPGGGFNQPVRLSRSHGWTMNGTTGGAYALNDAEAATSKNATLQGVSFTMRERIGYDEVARLEKTTGSARKRAFVNSTAYLVENLVETATFVGELQALHGQQSVGTITAVTDDGDGTGDITISAATHIAAMWAGLENGFIDIYDTTEATKRNAGGTLQVTSYDFANRKVYISGTAAEIAAIVATDVVYLRGTKSGGMTGLTKIASNTGTLWTIDGSATGYSLWGGNTHSAESGPLVFSKLMRALNKPSSKGGLMADSVALCHPMTWTDCMNDLSALRRYADKARGTLEQGADGLTFRTHTGSVELVPHLFQKPSQVVVYPKNKAKRIGPYDTTFKLPGGNENFFENLGGNAGYELRCYWNWAFYLPCPAQCVLINNIVNSDDA